MCSWAWRHQSIHDVENQCAHDPGVVTQVHPEQRRHWSLRERPARSRPPTSAPARAISRVRAPCGHPRRPRRDQIPPTAHRQGAARARRASPPGRHRRAGRRDARTRDVPGTGDVIPGASLQSKWVDLGQGREGGCRVAGKRPPHRLTLGRRCCLCLASARSRVGCLLAHVPNRWYDPRRSCWTGREGG